MRIADAENFIDETTALLTVMHSNNETGVLQPVTELAALARAAGALVHTDAAQSVGKVPVSVGDLDVDLLTVAGHKLYAPKGIGALYVRKGTPLDPSCAAAARNAASDRVPKTWLRLSALAPPVQSRNAISTSPQHA